ncbi:MAG: hypothetical protein ACK5QC_07620 [Bacteroidota bacterium]|jgi:hypothetical protein
MTESRIKGRLLFYTEQGMEGGYLSIQDDSLIKLINVDSVYGFGENRKVWDPKNPNRFGRTSNAEILFNDKWISYYDPIFKDDDYKISSLFCGELNGDKEADNRLSKKYNFRFKYSEERLNESYGKGNWSIEKCLPNVILKDGTKLIFGDHPSTEPQRPYGIPNDAIVRVTVEWNDAILEHQKLISELLIERWDYKGLHSLKEEDFITVYEPKTGLKINENVVSQIPLKTFSQTLDGHFDNTNSLWRKYFEENYNAEIKREDKSATNSTLPKAGLK